MKYKEIENYLFAAWKRSRKKGNLPPATVFIQGPPGIGKTSIPMSVVKRMGKEAILEVIDLTCYLPEDLGGMPARQDGKVVHEPMAWLFRLAQPGVIGVLVLDDMPAASPALASASRQLALYRSINGIKLSDGVLIVVTGNTAKDLANANTLPSNFRNAVCIFELEPDLSDWISWFLDQPFADHSISTYLKWRPQHFSQHPSEGDLKGSFPTPRAWTLFAQDKPSAEEAEVLFPYASGFLGEGVAREYHAYHAKFSHLPPLKDIYWKPQEAVPKPLETLVSADLLIAVSQGVGQVAALETRKKPYAVQIAGAVQMLRSLSWCVRHQREYMAPAIRSYVNLMGHSDALSQASERAKDLAPEVFEVLNTLREDVA